MFEVTILILVRISAMLRVGADISVACRGSISEACKCYDVLRCDLDSFRHDSLGTNYLSSLKKKQLSDRTMSRLTQTVAVELLF